MEVNLSSDLQTRLSHLADQQGRKSDASIVEAVERMVDYDTWFIAQVDKGFAQMEAGQTLSHEEAGTHLHAAPARARA